ncbi:MAG: tetratricopeptide repeat protein [Vicinamibacterales bacterium]
MPCRTVHTLLASLVIGCALCGTVRAQESRSTSANEREMLALLQSARYRDASNRLPSLLAEEPVPAASGSAQAAGAPTAPKAPRSASELALLTALVTNSWSPVERLNITTLSSHEQSAYWYIRGVLAARWAWPGGSREHLDVARDAADRLSLLASTEGTFSRSAVRQAAILAAMAGAQEEREQLTLLLGHAAHLDTQLDGLGAPPDRILPLSELAGELWLRIHRFDDAERYYRTVVERFPERSWAWVGLARAARDAGRLDAARTAATRVLAAWSGDEDLARGEMQALVDR